jgi:hypothetical protein
VTKRWMRGGGQERPIDIDGSAVDPDRGCKLRIRIIGDRSYGRTQRGRIWEGEGEGGDITTTDGQTDGRTGRWITSIKRSIHSTSGHITAHRLYRIEQEEWSGEKRSG